MIREAGDSAVLIELEPVIDPAVNARAIAIADAIRAAMVPGVRDVVPTYRSVAIYFNPLAVTMEEIRQLAERAHGVAAPAGTDSIVEVPVVYDGPDLTAVAERSGMRPDEVAERHAAREYRVFMLGFLPGFAYMGPVDPSIAAPRHATPRLRVKAGSVGIAGQQTGIYPCDSPGGWQLIGRTALQLFDPSDPRPARFAPGDRVRFVPTRDPRDAERRPGRGNSDTAESPGDKAAITVLAPGLLTTVQDRGRWGHQAVGVSVSGALDQAALATANLLVGNRVDAACLEATITGPELRAERSLTLALAGADLSARVDGQQLPVGRVATVTPGSVLKFGERRTGARTYIAAAGGIDVRPVLGSRSTHALSGVGRSPLRQGDRLNVGDAPGGEGAPQQEPVVAGGTRLRVLPGPQVDAFEQSALDLLQNSRFLISPQSNRMGYRLTGALIPCSGGDMISDAAFTGALQVPPSGEPILLMADRQTVGGYPQLAIVITADLPKAAQLAPGDWVEFFVCSHREALEALRRQEWVHG